MKILRIFLSILFLAGAIAQAQNYAITWYTVDGGGGTSTSALYSVSGTIGQPDAGTLTGGNFTLHGGFWGMIGVVQTEGAPTLLLSRTATNTVIVHWALPDTGWKLQASTNLAPSVINWAEIPPPYPSNTTNCYYIEPVPAGKKFFRLHKP